LSGGGLSRVGGSSCGEQERDEEEDRRQKLHGMVEDRNACKPVGRIGRERVGKKIAGRCCAAWWRIGTRADLLGA
jgi:hypothetical protein